MAKIRIERVEKLGRFKPGTSTEFFSENPELWRKIKNGEVIEVSEDVYKEEIVPVYGDLIRQSNRTISREGSRKSSSGGTESIEE